MVPDFYERLGVRSNADAAALEAALARMQGVWSAGTRNPKTRHAFQSYLDQVPVLRATLLTDAATREAYDDQLAEEQRKTRELRLDALQRLVRLRAAKGGLAPTDYEILRIEAERLNLQADDLDRLIASLPTLPEAPRPGGPSAADGPTIDLATRTRIRRTLEHLGRRDLYHLLDLPRDADGGKIKARAEAMRKRWNQKSQVTSERTAWLEAIAFVNAHLIESDDRATYDRSLTLEAEAALSATIEFAARGLTRIDPGTRHVLVEEAARLGIEPADANRLIDRHAGRNGFTSSGDDANGAAGAARRWLRCRNCGGITALEIAAEASESDACAHCQARLGWSCPQCRRASWIDQDHCPCGFPKTQVEPFSRCLRETDFALETGAFATALQYIDAALSIAPEHPEMRRLARDVRQRLAEIDAAREAFEHEHAREDFAAAQTALESWSNLVPPDDPELALARRDLDSAARHAGEHPSPSQAPAIAALPDDGVVPVVEALSLQRLADGRLRLSWPKPERGHVVIVRSSRSLDLVVGSVLAPERAEQLDAEVLECEGDDFTFDRAPLATGQGSYTPLTSCDGKLFVGRETSLSGLPDPRDLHAVHGTTNGQVQLRWEWGTHAAWTILLARSGVYPTGPEDRDARRFAVSEADYARLGYHALSLPHSDRGAWHIAAFSAARVDGEYVHSPGLDPTSRTTITPAHREITVSYRLRPPRFPGLSWSLCFRTGPPGQAIPPTVLVAHPRTVPLSADDGEVVDRFPASQDGATFRVRGRVRLAACHARVFPDPRAEPSELPPIRIRHPDAGGTRV